MGRKKVADMTPIERVDRVMTGMTNEDAESVAVHILSQLIAKRVCINEDFDYMDEVYDKIMEGVKNYATEHVTELAISRVFLQKEKENEHIKDNN